MAPALRIPVALDLESLKQQTEKASSHISSTLRLVSSNFTKLNGEITAGTAAASAAYAGGWVGAAAKVGGAFGLAALGATAAVSLLTGSIAEGFRQIEAMVKVADKARDVNLNPEAYQKFLLVARNLKVEVGDLDGALTRAFQNTKEKSPIDLAKWETADERITDVEKALRVYNLEAQKAGQQLQGLVLFRDAKDQEQKVMAVLSAMAQLNTMGKTLESLDLGERMFGSGFVDRIRQGKTSVEEILKTMQSASALSGDFFSNELVTRAKAIDDELRKANATLEKNLKPAWDGLASVALDIKNIWVSIVKLMGDAAGVFSFFGDAAELKRLKGDLESVNKALAAGTALYGLPALSGTERILTARKAELEALIKAKEPFQGPQITVSPSRGTGAAPTLKPEAKTGRDPFDRAADTVEKRTAALMAETASIDLNTQARERAKIVAELETVAKQANIAAGKTNTEVTAEQRVRIDEVAEAYGRASLAIERARAPLAAYGRESANVEKQLNQFAANALDGMTNDLAAVITGTKSLADAFKSMTASILQDLARIAIRKAITGPIADGLSGIFGRGAGGGGGAGASSTSVGVGANVGNNAAGTDSWRGGPTWVGERGPEIVNLPRGSQVIPNAIAARGGGGGGTDVVVNNYSSEPSRTEKRPGPNGREMVHVIIGEIKKDYGAGGFSQMNKNLYGLRQQGPKL